MSRSLSEWYSRGGCCCYFWGCSCWWGHASTRTTTAAASPSSCILISDICKTPISKQDHVLKFQEQKEKHRWSPVCLPLPPSDDPLKVNNTAFNPGKLCNVGFWEAMQEEDWDCVFFHDVNLLPEDDHNLYICDIFPAPVPWPSTSSTTREPGFGCNALNPED
ncbi:uncharacterized protein ACBT57_009815 isoform 1-T6 [Dama dama]